MHSAVRWLSMTARICLRFLFFSSVSMSTLPRPIFLPISPAKGIVVLNVSGVSESAAVDLSCSFRLGLWPTNIWAFCWHIAWTSCRAGVRERLTGVVLRGVRSGLAGAVLIGVMFSGLVVVALSGVAYSCFAEAKPSEVRVLAHLTERTLRGVALSAKTSSSLERLWCLCSCFRSVTSSSDWEPPSLSVESLCWRCKTERRFASARFGVLQFPLEAQSSSSWKEPSWSTEESWDLSSVRELKPLSSYAYLLGG